MEEREKLAKLLKDAYSKTDSDREKEAENVLIELEKRLTGIGFKKTLNPLKLKPSELVSSTLEMGYSMVNNEKTKVGVYYSPCISVHDVYFSVNTKIRKADSEEKMKSFSPREVENAWSYISNNI